MSAEQLGLFDVDERHTWDSGPYDPITWTGHPLRWRPSWPPCDHGLSLVDCWAAHGLWARCTVVHGLTNPLHRPDLTTCTCWPCQGRRCQVLRVDPHSGAWTPR